MPAGGLPGALGALLDDLSVSGGGHSLTFQYVPWGRHLDPDYWPDSEAESVLTVQNLTTPSRNTDIGGGAQASDVFLDVHAWWPDHPDLTDPDAFNEAFDDAVAATVRGQEASTGDAYFTGITNSLDVTDLLGDGATSSIAYHRIVTVRAFRHEVYG